MKCPGKLKGSKLEDYKILRSLGMRRQYNQKIGRGSYAEVKEAIHQPTGERVALKIYEKIDMLDSMKRNSVLQEIHVLESLEHPNIVRIYDCMDTGKYVVIVMECVKGQSLKQYLAGLKDHKLPEKEAADIFCQAVSAVEYCHSNGVSHRDLKLENIILTDQRKIKLIDFGFSVLIKNEGKLTMFCGTPTYMAPEIIGRPEYEGPPTDVWALGVILYVLLCGQFPFNSI